MRNLVFPYTIVLKEKTSSIGGFLQMETQPDARKIVLKQMAKKCVNHLRQAQFSGKKKARHVILIGVEGLFADQFHKLMTFPAFQKLKNEGAYSHALTTTYPTVSYPVLTSLVTGMYPNQHGIIHNHPFQPGIQDKQKIWYNYRSEIKRNTIYDWTQAHYLKTASLNWPVSGNSSITYNIPEITALKGENHHLKLLRASSKPFLLAQEIQYTSIEKKITECMKDSFYIQVALRTFARKRPHLLMLRLNALKKLQKKYGVHCSDQDYALQMYNDMLEKMIELAKKAKIFSDTVFIFVSVNGQVDVHTHVYLNNILEREDLITNRGTYIDYQACFQSTGNGAYLYVKNHNLKIEKHVREILEELKEAEIYGVKEIYTRNHLKKLHADLGIAMAVEGSPGFRFIDDFYEEDIVKLQKPDATSGYNPLQPEHKNILLMYGEAIQPSINLGDVKLVDIAPTIANILGLEHVVSDGRILEEALKMS